ncbi:MAG TPA: hypothetical protein VIW27_03590 [Gammaproteobacteria bacterium]|jgi:hypothetical protein
MKQANCGGGHNTLNGTWRENREHPSGGMHRMAITASGGNSIDSILIDEVDQGAAGVLTAEAANIRESHSPMALKAASSWIAPENI